MIVILDDGTIAVWPPALLTLDPEELCWSCGYRMGDHDVGYPCPDEQQVAYRWGYA